MFVQDNTVKSIKNYFFDRLAPKFSNSELKLMFNEFLIDHLKISRSDLISADSLKLSESDLLHFRSIVKRLETDEPFQYVLGSTEFYGLELYCDERALIPRPETEELVDWIIKESKNSKSIIDLCTGSGCIALALKSVLALAEIIAVDISEGAISLAKQNAHKTDLAVQFQLLDVLVETNEFSNQQFDLIVSNPPYIPKRDKSEMHKNVLDFEPEIALFVEDEDPLIFYRKISEFGLKHLKKGGILYFEIHEKFSTEVHELMIQLNYQNVQTRKDMQGKNRMICGELI